MASKQNVLSLIDASRKVRRPPLVGMQFLHQGTVGTADVVRARPRLQAKDLIGLLFSHFAAATPRALRRPHAASCCACSRQPGSLRSRYAASRVAAVAVDLAEQIDQRWQVERIQRVP